MTTLKRLAAIAVPLALALAAGSAWAEGSIAVTEPWARASAPAARNGAAYMVVSNGGAEADRIVAAESPVAEKAELHTHLMDNGVMKMRPVEAIEVSPGEPAVLRPGGLHVMLLGLKQPLTQGGRFPVTLKFAKAGAVTVEVAVQGAGAMGPGGMDHGHGGDHGAMHQQHMNQMHQHMHGGVPKQGQ